MPGMPRRYTYRLIADAPVSHRTVARLAAVDLSHWQIAAVTGLKPGTVEHILAYPVVVEHVRLLCDPAYLAPTVGVLELDRLILESLRRLSREVDDPELHRLVNGGEYLIYSLHDGVFEQKLLASRAGEDWQFLDDDNR